MGSIARSLRTHGNLPANTALALEGIAKEVFNVVMDDTDDVTGGGSSAAVGFQLTDFNGDNVEEEVVLQFAVFDDGDGAAPAANSTLDTASAGTILNGASTNALLVKTDAAGRFTCILTDGTDETVWVICGSSSFRAPALDSRGRDSITFSA